MGKWGLLHLIVAISLQLLLVGAHLVPLDTQTFFYRFFLPKELNSCKLLKIFKTNPFFPPEKIVAFW